MAEETISITREELNLVIEVERIKTRQEINEGSFKSHIESTEPLLREILSSIQKQPHDMLQCRNDLMKEVEDEFMTKVEAKQMEIRIEAKVETIKTKLSWVLSIVIFVVTISSQFLINIIGGH